MSDSPVCPYCRGQCSDGTECGMNIIADKEHDEPQNGESSQDEKIEPREGWPETSEEEVEKVSEMSKQAMKEILEKKDDVDLPVAASAKVYEEPSTGDLRTQFVDEDNPAARISHEDELVKKRDAEEAIQRREESVRREIINKIEDKIRKLKASRSSKSGSSYRISELEELRDDLKQDREEEE